MKRALITGGIGFIGSQFVRSFINKYELGILDSLTYASDLKRIPDQLWQDINFYHKDIRSLDDVLEVYKAFKPEVVVHFGAESHVDNSIKNPHIFMETNVQGTLNMLIGAVQHPVERFINISTDEIFGESLNISDKKYEYDNYNPSSPYAVSKATADILGNSYYRMFNIPLITVRPSNNYGIGQHTEKLIAKTINNAINNVIIPIYSNGLNFRQWLHIEDTCNAIDLLIKKGEIGQVYNIGGDDYRSNIEIVKYIINYLNKSEDLIKYIDDRKGHDFGYSINCDKIKNIGWKPCKKIEEELSRVIEWQKKKEQNNITYI